MLNTAGLYDPKTKKCCVNRCSKVLTAMEGSINGLVNQILRNLTERVSDLEDRTTEKTITCCTTLTARVKAVEDSLADLYRPLQNAILTRYSEIIERTERLTGQANVPTPEETKMSDSPSTDTQSSPIPPTRTHPSPAPRTPAEKESCTISPMLGRCLPTPDSVKPKTSKQEDCVYNDLCSPLYGWFWFWFEWAYQYIAWWEKMQRELMKREPQLLQFLDNVLSNNVTINVVVVPPNTPQVEKPPEKKPGEPAQVSAVTSYYYEPNPGVITAIEDALEGETDDE